MKSSSDQDYIYPDFWTLEVLAKPICMFVAYACSMKLLTIFARSVYPTVGDVIDDDSSGFVSVGELNHFSARLPKGWSMAEWITL